MAEEAKRKLEATSTSTKRKKGAAGKNKKGKNSKGEANLKTAQEKCTETQVGGGGGRPPIFTQPALLAKGCLLKDYQLEGVRWLTSLFENGVSGILADVSTDNSTVYILHICYRYHTLLQ